MEGDRTFPGTGEAGDRVKTDRRDAVKLAAAIAPVILTLVWVPDAGHEALCATCCVLAKAPDRINGEAVTGWESFCCATVADRRKTLRKLDATNTWTG